MPDIETSSHDAHAVSALAAAGDLAQTSASSSDAGSGYGQIVLVLQGGGALGAYQAGVYEAMSEAGMEPDWVIGTSIGAINAALIAGSPPDRRLSSLRAFWDCVTHRPMDSLLSCFPWFGTAAQATATMAGGIPGFFEPNPLALLGPHSAVGAGRAAYYLTEPLDRTLRDLVDPDFLNAGSPRCTVGAARVGNGEMRYFDSARERLSVLHVMASGALPPAFPAVRIDGELYWDGGVLSNTPVEAVFDDNPRRSALVFAVHIWNPEGQEPDSIWKVMSRQKDLQYASRSISHVARQKQLHKLRHVIASLGSLVPPELRETSEVRDLEAYGCTTRMHVVRLLAPPLEGEDLAKDIDFSRGSIASRWSSGREDTARVIAQRPWEQGCDPSEGLILHEAQSGRIIA